MQKLDQLSVRTIFTPVRVNADMTQFRRRLVVLVSNSEMDTPAVARRVLEIAHAFQCPILFLGLCSDKSQESSLRRQIVTLSAMVRDEAIMFETQVEIDKNWLKLVKANSTTGDIFICFSHQKGMIHALLESNFASTVYVLDDLSPLEQNRATWVSPALAWVGSIFIILAFLWLQIKALPGMVTFILSIPVETWLILAWNSLFELR